MDPTPTLKRTSTGLTPTQITAYDAQIPEAARQIWEKYSALNKRGDGTQRAAEMPVAEFERRFVHHVEFSLARSMYNCDALAAYQAAAQTIRDAVLRDWANTQQRQTEHGGKRVYYFSLEFLMGRAMDNAMINVGARGAVDSTLFQLGFRMEDVLRQEPDAGLGNGGLGRLAACFVDSLSARNYSGWGYGLCYQYGIFKQAVVDGRQVEMPDYWLQYSNPWEIARHEIQIPVDFYGRVEETRDGRTGETRRAWTGAERVLAVAADWPVPGFAAATTNNLRLWRARPTDEFDFGQFNAGAYSSSVAAQQRAEAITAVLYPNDNFVSGKELRLKQQYFWVAASLHDIVRRYKKNHGRSLGWAHFADKVAVQLNDTHPTLAIVELQRILVDAERLPWEQAWEIVTATFAYTNHTVMAEALEKWPVHLLGTLLPRHLELVYEINRRFLQHVEARFPGDHDLVRRVSLIEEGDCKAVRMAYLAIVGSHKVNGVAELHSALIQTTIFRDFVAVFGRDRFTNVTNGITPRRWLRQANPQLAALIADALQDPAYEYLTNLGRLKRLEAFAADAAFLDRWAAVKLHNKQRLAALIKSETGVAVDPAAMFDVQVKRIHEYKRQQMNIFAVIHRYLHIKELLAQGVAVADIARKHYVPKVCVFGGKAAPGYYMAKTIIHLVNSVAAVVNSDDLGGLLKVVFVPDYNVSKAEVICPGSDVSNHISTAGTEASGTSNMKFALNGGLIIGTVDGANVEIAREIGEDNIFLFGNLAESVDGLRHQHECHGVRVPASLQKVLDAVDGGVFGDAGEYRPLVDSITHHDSYLVTDDFDLMLACQQRLEKVYARNDRSWVRKSVLSVANMGFFSSDRCIDEYAENIWNVEPLSA